MSTAPVRGISNLIALNTGASIHQLGFGTWQAAAGQVGAAVNIAVRAGFRHIDCARVYRNEAEIGEAFKKLFDEGVVKREDLFVTSKLWNTDHHPDDVEAACFRSISELQVGYLDLYLIHWPISWPNIDGNLFPESEAGGTLQRPVSLRDTWKAMEALVDKGLVKAIGISNFTVEQARDIIGNARIMPAAHQVEAHPCLPQDELRALHAEHGIVLQAYCPLGIGMFDTAKGLIAHPGIVAIAEKAGVSAGELLLRWNLAQGNVVLSKSVTPARIASNAATVVGGLSEEVMEALRAFGEANPFRVCNPQTFHEEPRLFFQDGFPNELA